MRGRGGTSGRQAAEDHREQKCDVAKGWRDRGLSDIVLIVMLFALAVLIFVSGRETGRAMQTTEMYTRADPSVKLEALEAMIALKLRSGRFRAPDKLIASLTSRSVMRGNTPSR